MPKMIFICIVADITFRDKVERSDMWGELKVEMLLLALKGLCRRFVISASTSVFWSRPADTAGDLVLDILYLICTSIWERSRGKMFGRGSFGIS